MDETRYAKVKTMLEFEERVAHYEGLGYDHLNAQHIVGVEMFNEINDRLSVMNCGLWK